MEELRTVILITSTISAIIILLEGAFSLTENLLKKVVIVKQGEYYFLAYKKRLFFIFIGWHLITMTPGFGALIYAEKALKEYYKEIEDQKIIEVKPEKKVITRDTEWL